EPHEDAEAGEVDPESDVEEEDRADHDGLFVQAMIVVHGRVREDDRHRREGDDGQPRVPPGHDPPQLPLRHGPDLADDRPVPGRRLRRGLRAHTASVSEPIRYWYTAPTSSSAGATES